MIVASQSIKQQMRQALTTKGTRSNFVCFFSLRVCYHWFRSLIGEWSLLTALCVLPLMLADQGLFHLAVLVLLLGMGFYMAVRLLILRHGAAPTNTTCLCWFGLCSSVVCCTSWHVVMYGSGRNSWQDKCVVADCSGETDLVDVDETTVAFRTLPFDLDWRRLYMVGDRLDHQTSI